jgi:hypothetical protein
VLRTHAVLFQCSIFSSSIFLFLVSSIFFSFSLYYSCSLSCSVSIVQYSSFSNFLSFVFSTFHCSVSFYLLCSVFFVVQYSCSLIFSASSVQYSLFSTFSSLVFSIHFLGAVHFYLVIFSSDLLCSVIISRLVTSLVQ